MFARLFEPVESRSITVQDMWGPWGNLAYSSAGQAVSSSSAVQLLAVYGCVRLITDSISTLPIDVYRKTADGRQELPTPRWIEQPTANLDFESWCGQVLVSLLLHGNAYVWVTYGQTGINELIPVDPTKVTSRRVAGRLTYFYQGTEFSPLHIKGIMMPGSDVGLSPIEAAQRSIGLGLAAQQYGSNWFEGEGNMPGVISLPKPVQSAGKLKEIGEQWREKRRKGGRGLPGVLDDGAQWIPTGVTNEAAQFLATRQFSAAEIAGQMFLVDPTELGIPVAGTSLTYMNLTERKTRLAQVTLAPWIIRIERALSALLAKPRYVKFNMDAFLRADLKARYDSYEVAERINTSAAARGEAPLLETAEMRQNEDLPPLPQPAPPVPAQAPVVASAARSEDDDMQIHNHVHLPETWRLETPAPTVTNIINNPEPVVNVEGPTVNVAAPEVRVEGPQITVPVPLVNVEMPKPQPVKRRVQRDDKGRIVGIEES